MIKKTEKEIMSSWKGDTGSPLVSVRCLTYNHANYLGEALDSFLNQVTDFRFEIIVHDDASTDGTTDILREYASNFPSIIVPIIQTENQYSKNNGKIIREAINSKIHGKYVALCEGDDYWCDPNKLQLQIEFMECHPDCVLSMHNGFVLNGKTNKLGGKINPYKNSGFLTPREVLVEKKSFPPTASMVYIAEMEKQRPADVFDAPVGDRPLRMYFLTKGKIYYSDKAMCVYRNNQGGGSFGTRVKQDREYAKTIYERMRAFYDRYNEYTNKAYSDEIDLLISKEEYNYYVRIGQREKSFRTEYFMNYYPKLDAFIIKARHRAAGILPKEIVKLVKNRLGV